jgi:hypothetical protein
LIDAAYLACLARAPSDDEKQSLRAIFSESLDIERRVLIEDLFWSLLSSREFFFNQ